VDVGNNSVHLLVALVGFGLVEPLRDRSELLGLGDVVDRNGSIPEEQLGTLTQLLKDYAVAARRSGAERLTLVGTDPLRHAANAAQVIDAVAEATGTTLRVLTEQEEATLTFVGATRGRAPDGPLVVVDIGGGSTEVASWGPGVPMRLQSLPIGSSRLTHAFVEHDPPTDAEVEAMFEAAADVAGTLAQEFSTPSGATGAARAVFVGGTATNVARLGQLSIEHLIADRFTLGRLNVDQVVSRYGVRPQRAKQLAAGVAIVHALLNAFGTDTAEVSEASLRDGAIIAAARFGDSWPEHLAELLPS
jgi:exopolyphosphatase/guanosine-5'-triphosphate,3'-diphosphate pyrophosphatase